MYVVDTVRIHSWKVMDHVVEVYDFGAFTFGYNGWFCAGDLFSFQTQRC